MSSLALAALGPTDSLGMSALVLVALLAAVVTGEIRATKYQARVLSLPDSTDWILAAARGVGKTYLVALEILRRAERWPGKTRTLVIRRSAVALAEFRLELESILRARYGSGLRVNGQLGTFETPAGDFIQLGYLESKSDLTRWQGQSFDLLVFEEAGQMPDLGLCDLMLGCLRSASGVPTRVIWCCNAGGVAHSAIYRRWLKRTQPWAPYRDSFSGRLYVVCPAVTSENDFLPAEYERQGRAVERVDPGLYLAWFKNDWTAALGDAFGACWDDDRNIVPSLSSLPSFDGRPILSVDWGSARPAYCTFGYRVRKESPIELELEERKHVIGPGSYILFDEYCTASPHDLNMGDNSPAEEVGHEIAERCKAWGMKPVGYLDCAEFHASSQDQVTVAALFRRAGVRLVPGKKGRRVPRIQRVKELMQGAGDPKKAGLYVTRSCGYWLATVPYLPRHPRNVEDVDSSGPDHALDSTSYLIEGGPLPYDGPPIQHLIY
jgi:hypothetical protein